MRIVGFLGDHPRSEFSLSEVARAVDLSKTTCQSILAALCESGTITKDLATLRYSIGPAVIGLGIAAAERFDFLGVARVELEEFCAPEGLDWTVGALVGQDPVVLAASKRGSLGVTPGQRIALSPPIGLVLLGWSPPELVTRWLRESGDFEDPVLREKYRAAIDVTRVRGFSVGKKSEAQSRFVGALGSLVNSVERAELVETARALLAELTLEEYFQDIVDSDQEYAIEFLSVPMFDRQGGLLGAITVGGFKNPLSGREVLEMASRLGERGKRISYTHAGGPVAR
jgi:DNA-binding IclR family transcriptional regulator